MRHPIRVLTYIHLNHAWRQGKTSHYPDAPPADLVHTKLHKATLSGCPAVVLLQYRLPREPWQDGEEFAYQIPGRAAVVAQLPETGWVEMLEEKFGLRAMVE